MLKFILLFVLFLLVIRYLRYLTRLLAGRNNNSQNQNPTRVNNPTYRNPTPDVKEGEYIEFEEVKKS